MMYGNFTERELDAFWIGIETEQTRIVKILENLIKSRSEDWELLNKGYTFEHLLNLIKGKNEHTYF